MHAFRPTRRTLLSLSAATAVSGAIACTPGGGSSGGSGETYSASDVESALEEGASITVWTTIPAFDAAADAFKEAYPKVTVNVEQIQGNTSAQQLRTAIEAGSGIPDVMGFPSTDTTASFVLAGDLLDLTGFGAGELESFYVPGAWSMVAYADGIWGLPHDTGPMAVMYRSDYLEQAGLSEFPVTWDELPTAARTFKEATGRYLVNFDSIGALALPFQHGVPPFGWDGAEGITVATDTPEVVKVLELWDALIEEDLAAFDTGFNDTWYQGLANGKYGSWIGPAWGPKFLQGTAAGTEGKWAVSLLPQWEGEEPRQINSGGSQFSIPQGAENPLVAYGFLRWLNADPEQFSLLTDGLGNFPAAVDALADHSWTAKPHEFFGGQPINEVFSEAAGAIEIPAPNPLGVYSANSFADNVTAAIGSSDLVAAYAAWGEDVSAYAKQQGLSVSDG